MVVASCIAFGAGVIVGYLIHKILSAPVKAGVLFFYDEEESGGPPTMAAGLDMPVEEVQKYDYVTFKVHSRR